MGQKVNPNGFRLGINKRWLSRWYCASSEVGSSFLRDHHIRRIITSHRKEGCIDRIDIEKMAKYLSIAISTSKPGLWLGKKGASVSLLNKTLQDTVKCPVAIEIVEVNKAHLSANIVSEQIATLVRTRTSIKRQLSYIASLVMKEGALGVKILVAGRINGAEIATSECVRLGRVPTHTIRAHISYGCSTSHTKYGCIGIKTWIFLKEVKGQARL